MGVHLVPLSMASDPSLLTAVLALVLRPGQDDFVIPASETFAAAAADPDRTPFAVLPDAVAGGGTAAAGTGTDTGSGGTAEQPVGFGVLDRRGHLAALVDDPGRAVLLRAFFVDAGHQGRGFGTAAARAVRSLAPRVAPSADLVVLTVHERNAPARAAYARAGYVDTGARHAAVPGDPQAVLVASVTPRA